MARIYEAPQFEGGYQRNAQSRGFAPEQAIDRTRQEQLKAQAALDREKVKARALARQQEIDQGIQRGEQTIEKARQTIQHSQDNANLSLLKGLASFSSTAAGALQKFGKEAEERQAVKEQEDYENGVLSQLGWGGFNDSTEEAIQGVEEREYQVQAESQAIGEVQQDLYAQGDVSTAQQLGASSTYNQEAPIRRTVAQARAMHGPWLLEQVREINLAGMSDEQIMAEVTRLNKQFTAGGTGGNRRMLLELARTMQANTSSAISSMFARRAKQQGEIASLEEKDNIAVAGLEFNAADAWRKATEATAVTDGGRNPLSQRRALEGLLNTYANDPVDGARRIRELMGVEGQPGNKGTVLGTDPRYQALFRDSLDKAEKAAIDDFSHEAQKDTFEIAQISKDYLKNPTPENKAAAIAALQANGSVAALKQAKLLMGNGLGIIDSLEADIELRFKSEDPYTQEEMDAFLAEGKISPEVYEKYGPNAVGQEHVARATGVTKGLESSLENNLKNNVFENGVRIDAPLSNEELRSSSAQIKIRARHMNAQLTKMLAKWAKDNPDGDPSAMVDTYIKQLLNRPEYQLDASEGGAFLGFKSSLPGRPKSITLDKSQARRYSAHTPEEIREIRKTPDAVQTTRDILVSPTDLRADADAMSRGKAPSVRTIEMAGELGISTRELVDNQMRLQGFGSLGALTGAYRLEQRQERLEELRNAAPVNLRTSMSEFQSYGVPAKASLQLANLTQVNYVAGDNKGGLKGMSQLQRDVLNRIAKPESGGLGYDAMNKGGSHGGRVAYGSGAAKDTFGKQLTDMTIGELLQHGAAGRIHAAGRYQFIHSTLKERVQKLGIPLTAKFDKATQDYITLDYLRVNPTAWVGVNEKDPGAIRLMNSAAQQPLPPAPWLSGPNGGAVDPIHIMETLLVSNPRAYQTVMNPRSSDLQVRAAIMDGYGRQAGRVMTVANTTNQARKVYTTGTLGYGSTADHLDVKGVTPGGLYGDKSIRLTRGELDRYVAVATDNGLIPLSQAMEVTQTEQDHRNRGSHGIDYASYQPNREIYLTNGARVVENWVDNSARGEGSHRLLIEVPGGKRYAFVHGTSQIQPANGMLI